MISVRDLKAIVRARLKDAEVLTNARRYDGAVYLCGYAVEIALKARICAALKWGGYPSTRSEFNNYRTFQTHNLDVLLRLSGKEGIIKTRHFLEWSVVGSWEPETRYQPIGTATKRDATDLISATRVLVRVL